MLPNYVAKRSAFFRIKPLLILSCILIIPIFVVIYLLWENSKFKIEFYDDKIVVRKGLWRISRQQFAFMGIVSTDVEQSIWGRIFHYGKVKFNCVGGWDLIKLEDDKHRRYDEWIKNPRRLEEYLKTQIVRSHQASRYVPV